MQADDGSEHHVYGCYAAVVLADARALHALKNSLGNSLLMDRHWQQGAYTCEVSV